MVLVRTAVIVTIAVVCAVTAYGENAVGLDSGIWDVRTLVPGRGSIPPSHELHVESDRWALRERNFSRMRQLLDSTAAKLGVIYTAVPSSETKLCRATPSLRFEWAATRSDDGFSVDCLSVDWFTAASLHKFAGEGSFHSHFDRPKPLSVGWSGACVATSWSLRDIFFAKVAGGGVIVSATLTDNSNGTPVPCKAFFEVTRRPTAAAAEKSLSSSVYVPIAMLLVVIAMRLLPRYILTRNGQIDPSSYRGQNPANLSSAHRAELLQKQRRIIEQMKAEDRANAPKEKTS
ncbi:hypothetical protein ABB37_04919 [Leptomonas pyrrhocoris]|uniref:Transmembrane protein n=1 Tax=Leptomonas pyrrhocoris TaxID=157538 RepID=A0A0N0VF12_LEPPY|nr:hypothetical protein ABB37_04919 [Leptomonas pyrrhocoris]XP_015658267.1 hypothetical protein ABB37_04919 [Leptomonas pyrrhocoris]KPA79827.1 hypothetical protein ABB37_04919 [Leptomonas pyrrhocoris]KPA79828.1 hypothetical protein ABB37_04919 [Leptomonas pyrrhocoris]|eukprot:XP_015658266.1 hypothetical protein ABB37_04919 [Leptomonas pyrrhocoris]